jgi:hypothetical protein
MLTCPVMPDSGLTVKPPGIPPKIKELLGSGVSDNPTIQPDDSISPIDKGLLGLLDETSPTIQPDDDSSIPPKGKGFLGLLDTPTIQQQPLPEIATPQKNIPSTDLLSNLDNDNLLTSVPKQNEPLNLLEEKDEEFSIIETKAMMMKIF